MQLPSQKSPWALTQLRYRTIHIDPEKCLPSKKYTSAHVSLPVTNYSIKDVKIICQVHACLRNYTGAFILYYAAPK